MRLWTTICTMAMPLFLFLAGGCSKFRVLDEFYPGTHELTLYEVTGGDVSTLPAWALSCKIDCGLFDDERTIYFIEIFTLDSLSVVFPTENTVIVVPFEDGVAVSEYNCFIYLDSLDCEYNNGCDYGR